MMNDFVRESSEGKIFVLRKEDVSVDELVRIGRELGVICE